MATNSARNKFTRYVQGGNTTIFNNRLGWWERRKIPTHHSDQTFVVRGRYVHRPDLIAQQMYNRADLAWLVLQYNNIVDTIEELTEGTTLTLPTYNRVLMQILTQPIEGNSVR